MRQFVKILTLTSSYPKYPGDSTAPFIESITRSLAERGHELTVVLPARSDLAPRPIPGVSFRAYSYAPVPALARFGYAESLKADVALRWSAALVAPLALASGSARLLREASRGSWDALHAHWVVPNAAMALPASRLKALPLVVSLHGSDVFLSERKALFRRAARRAFERAAAVTACSADLAERGRALGAREPIETIPYGVDAERFRPDREAGARVRARLGFSAEQPLVLAAGRLVHKKGFEVLIESVPRLLSRWPELKVVIAGRGDLGRALAQQAARQGTEGAVLLVGDVSHEELPAFFAAATVVAVPSIRDPAGNVDGLPNVVLEAMASGAPLVASAVGGIPHAIESGKSGWLVAEKDPAALAEVIDRLLGSPAERQSLGEAARRRARERFSWSRVGERFEALFAAVARARGKKD